MYWLNLAVWFHLLLDLVGEFTRGLTLVLWVWANCYHNFGRQVLGLKAGKKQDINLEAYYEKKSKRESSSFKEEHVQANMVDPADALPVKTLSRELHYRTSN